MAEQEEDTFREAVEGATLTQVNIHAEEVVAPHLTEVEGNLPILAWIPKEEVAPVLTEVEGTLPILAWITKNIQTQTQHTNGGAAITLGSLVDHKSKIHTIRNPKHSCMHRSLTTLLIQNNRINLSNYTKSARLWNAKVFSMF